MKAQLKLNLLREIQVVELYLVHSQDSSIDPVGACVGMRGSRVQTIVNEPWRKNRYY